MSLCIRIATTSQPPFSPPYSPQFLDVSLSHVRYPQFLSVSSSRVLSYSPNTHTDSHTDSLMYSLTRNHSLTHSLTHPPTHSLTHALAITHSDHYFRLRLRGAVVRAVADSHHYDWGEPTLCCNRKTHVSHTHIHTHTHTPLLCSYTLHYLILTLTTFVLTRRLSR